MPHKTRIIPTICFSNGIAYKPLSFAERRTLGPLMQMVRVHQRREIDELILLDIDATKESREPDYETIAEVATELFSPLTVGGGVKTLEHIAQLLRHGADKVAIKSGANAPFIRAAADKFGSQAIVIAIDVTTAKEAWVPALHAEQAGAGELLVTSMPRDGTMQGYDLEMVKLASENVSIPVIANGGCGSYEDMLDAIKAGAHAVAAASLFQFTQATPKGACEFLAKHGIPVRLAA